MIFIKVEKISQSKVQFGTPSVCSLFTSDRRLFFGNLPGSMRTKNGLFGNLLDFFHLSTIVIFHILLSYKSNATYYIHYDTCGKDTDHI